MSVKKGMIEKSAVLVSGGLDSATLLAERVCRDNIVYPLYIREGLRWETDELKSLQRFLKAIHTSSLKPLTILEFPIQPIYGNHWSVTNKKVPGFHSKDQAVYLPGRNLGLVALASLYCVQKKIPQLYLAPLQGNPFSDSKPQFFRMFERLIRKGTGFALKIKTPYLQMTKMEVIQRGEKLPLELTFSCLNPKNGKHCGHCNKCAERQKAFKQAKVQDKTAYARK
ncbi:MAG: 7-cyano-7-deazaguanine synthase [Deltaproteobacteria bacterium]|nr:7-cyano-7-deazaguanine synthase [Deltaproteobacteria bacterium]